MFCAAAAEASRTSGRAAALVIVGVVDNVVTRGRMDIIDDHVIVLLVCPQLSALRTSLVDKTYMVVRLESDIQNNISYINSLTSKHPASADVQWAFHLLPDVQCRPARA